MITIIKPLSLYRVKGYAYNNNNNNNNQKRLFEDYSNSLFYCYKRTVIFYRDIAYISFHFHTDKVRFYQLYHS